MTDTLQSLDEIVPFTEPEHQPFTFGEGPHSALLIHGFPGTPAETRPLGLALADAGFHVRGVLLPGFGPDILNLHERSSQDWLNHIEDIWNQMEDGQRTLIGYSLGGALSINMVKALRPDKLVLIAPFWKLPGFLPKLVPLAKYVMPEYKPFANADFDDAETRQQFERILPGIDMDDPEVQERIRTGLTLPMDTIDQVLKMGAQAKRKTPYITMPCLVIQGDADEVVLPKFTRQLVSHIPDRLLTYIEIEGEHEIIHAHAPERHTVAQTVIDFLQEEA